MDVVGARQHARTGTSGCWMRPNGSAGPPTGGTRTGPFPDRLRAREDRARRYTGLRPGAGELRSDLRPVRRAARQARGPGRRLRALRRAFRYLVALAVARTPSAWTWNGLTGARARWVVTAIRRRSPGWCWPRPSAPPWTRSSGRSARAFLVAWTRKEAVTKATGDGLHAAFSEVVVAGARGRRGWWPGPTRGRRTPCPWWTYAATGYVAALAVIGRCEAVLPRDGSALLAASTRAGPESRGLRCQG